MTSSPKRKSAGGKERFVDPVEYYLDYKDSVLTLHFMLPFKKPVNSKTLTLEIFDPTYFVDFTFAQKDPVSLAVRLRPASSISRDRPRTTQPRRNCPSNRSSMAPTPIFGANFATKVAVNC